MSLSGSTGADQANHFKGFSMDEDKCNKWSSKCFAYSRSQAITCAPVTSGSFVRLEYDLYSKAYVRSFIEPRSYTAMVSELAALLGKIGSRGLHTLAPCSVLTSVFDLVPSYGVLALNSAYTGSGESIIDNLVRDLKQANSLVPTEQQCTIKSSVVTLNIMSSKALHPVRNTSSLGDGSERDSSSDHEGNSDEEDDDYNNYSERSRSRDVLIRFFFSISFYLITSRDATCAVSKG